MQSDRMDAASTHVTGQPPILYFGTPVVLISTLNPDGSANLAPMSSAFWLGWRCMIGMNSGARTTENLMRGGECVLNLPSDTMAGMVDRLALTTGSDPVPERKATRGYRFERRKFEIAGMTEVASELVAPPRTAECPVAMEAVVTHSRAMAEEHAVVSQFARVFELKIRRVHLHPAILMDGNPDRVDPDRWRPLIMSFARFYGLSAGQAHPSALTRIPEKAYASPDMFEAAAG